LNPDCYFASASYAVLEEYDENIAVRYLDHLAELSALLGVTRAFVSEVLANPRCRNYRWLVTNSNLSRVAGEPAFAELARSLYVQWLKDVEFFGKTLLAPPPELPDPKSLIPTPLAATAAR
jgi:hypothetical protein